MMQLIFQYLVVTTCLMLHVCLAGSTEEGSLPGHLQVLGKHQPPEGHIEILHDPPSPKEFWEKYARDGIPVLFRGMANNSLGVHRWTDDYLREHYSDLRVKIEAKAEKEYYPEGDKGIGQDTVGYFLKTYKSRNAYIVSQLPDPMSKEVSVPPFMTCGTFSQRLLEANLWFSSGGTKSLLHRDADNAINCLYFGTKDWIFIDSKHEDMIPIADEETEAYGGYAVLNPDSVDLEKFPKFADVPWTYGNVTAGDCIFLPRGYWHQVRSYGSRNLAVSLLFSRIKDNDLSDCEGAKLSYTPLSDMEMVFTYDGYAEQSMGDTDPFELNETFQEWCRHSGSAMSTQDVFGYLRRDFHDRDADDENSMGGAAFLLEIADQVVQLLDVDRDNKVSCREEAQGLKLATLKKLAHIIDRDPANTEEYEYAKFEPDEIRDFISDLISSHESGGQAIISREDFVKAYQKFGGSQKIGNEVFDILTSEEEESVSTFHLKDQVENISALFEPKMKHQKADLRWEEQDDAWMAEHLSPQSHGEL
ncbi:uncharacterized protein LOC100889833 [Strongylocentrotus purpuratus]|uniref:JmjC domain-containing protein n=1 Tax=Strongylocentrotus purpuratus TaxID=7668 RepID=A0A7M7NXP3_STRPU|nr:uncharacterized protein LOC100889833 [Strongylocentrotus purpuratus]XP_030842974.1 uncharacterized protein LOC100889833 [Strongylocentrotus purpuratus]XP_030842975.1 uncharacterized protein LOC100889833 [Strongylocentrotus purpuratus]